MRNNMFSPDNLLAYVKFFLNCYVWILPCVCIYLASNCLQEHIFSIKDPKHRYDDIKAKFFYETRVGASYRITIMSIILILFSTYTGLFHVYRLNFSYYGYLLVTINFNLDKLWYLAIAQITISIALYFYTQNLDFERMRNQTHDRRSPHCCFYFLYKIYYLHTFVHALFMLEGTATFLILYGVVTLWIFRITGVFQKKPFTYKIIYGIHFILIPALLLYFSERSRFILPIEISLPMEIAGTTSVIISDQETAIYLLFFLYFANGLGLFPFHNWLSKVHAESTTEGSIVLSGVLTPISIYGITKYCKELFPTVDVAPYILPVTLIGAIVAAFSMFWRRNSDIKKIIVYSSALQVNMAIWILVTCPESFLKFFSAFSFTHALSYAGLFCAVGYLDNTIKTRNLLELSGIGQYMPSVWSFCFIILMNAAILPNAAALPTAAGFWSPHQFMMLLLSQREATPYIFYSFLAPAVIFYLTNFYICAILWARAPSDYVKSYTSTSFEESSQITISYKIGRILFFTCFFSVFNIDELVAKALQVVGYIFLWY